MLRNLGMFKSWMIVAVFVIVSGILLGAAIVGFDYLLHSGKEPQEEELVIPMGTHLVYQDENTRVYEIPPKEDGGNTYILTKVYDKKNDVWVPFSVSTK